MKKPTPSPLDLRGSIRTARRAFRGLPVPTSAAGDWRAEFAGPQWLRLLAPLGLNLSVLRGWYGKSFDDDGNAINLVRRNGQLQRVLPMQASVRHSRLDGGLVLATHYGDDAPVLLLRVSDEFRSIDKNTLLGMMTIDLPAVRGLSLPFLLRRIESRGAAFRR
ncbi:MAG: hypothetical protein ACRETM_10550 [Stenotrophobium sp.]